MTTKRITKSSQKFPKGMKALPERESFDHLHGAVVELGTVEAGLVGGLQAGGRRVRHVQHFWELKVLQRPLLQKLGK